MRESHAGNPTNTLTDLRSQLDEQTREVSSILGERRASEVTRRPPSGKWSVVEHVDHLIKLNRAYAGALESAIEKGRADERFGSGPFRGSMLGRFFARMMEPPVRMRVKTLPDMQPDSTLDPDATLAEFLGIQRKLGDLLRASEGLDLDRIRMSSPFLRLLRAPVFSWFCVITAHTRRHVWLMRETLDQLGGEGG